MNWREEVRYEALGAGGGGGPPSMPAVFEISSHDTQHDQRLKKPFSSRNYFDL